MRKYYIILVIIVLAAFTSVYGPNVKSWFAKNPKLGQLISNNQTIQDLKQQVFNGGALRGDQDSPQAYLTRVGVIDFTNKARGENGGLPALVENQKLDQAARAKLNDMFNLQYFEHVSPDGKGPSAVATAAGYEYVVIGENLALGNFKDDAALVEAWMNSPGHRANILGVKYSEIGVAVGQGVFEGRKTWLAVQEFGKPVSACPFVDPALKAKINSLKGDIDGISPQLEKLKSEIDGSPQPTTQEESNSYNQKVGEYNALVKIYNNKVDQLKQATSEYNAQVQAFNACVG